MGFLCFGALARRPNDKHAGSRTIRRETSPPLPPRQALRIQAQTRSMIQARKEVVREERVAFERLSEEFMLILDQLDKTFLDAGVPQESVDTWCIGFQRNIEFDALPEVQQRLAYWNLQALMESTKPVRQTLPFGTFCAAR